MNAPLEGYLLVSAILFCLGIFTVLSRRNAVSVLMGVELVLNSANINFVAFSRYIWHPEYLARQKLPENVSLAGLGANLGDPSIAGQVFAIFVILLAAAEAAVALAIFLRIFRNMGTVNVDETIRLRH